MIDDNELSIMIDSVIRVLNDEVERFEKAHDQAPYLCSILDGHFRLLIENFNNNRYEELYGIRKNTQTDNNIVIGMVYRKICKEYERLLISDAEERGQELRALVKGV
jgi:hypothetical protein